MFTQICRFRTASTRTGHSPPFAIALNGRSPAREIFGQLLQAIKASIGPWHSYHGRDRI